MKKCYKWKVLSEDGLLKDHPPFGPYYSEESFYEHETEESAISQLESFRVRYEYQVKHEMVLLQVYKPY